MFDEQQRKRKVVHQCSPNGHITKAFEHCIRCCRFANALLDIAELGIEPRRKVDITRRVVSDGRDDFVGRIRG